MQQWLRVLGSDGFGFLAPLPLPNLVSSITSPEGWEQCGLCRVSVGMESIFTPPLGKEQGVFAHFTKE